MKYKIPKIGILFFILILFSSLTFAITINTEGYYSDLISPYSVENVVKLTNDNNILYSLSGIDSEITILNLSDGGNPEVIGNYIDNSGDDAITGANDMSLYNDLLAIVSFTSENLVLLNVSTTTPVLLDYLHESYNVQEKAVTQKENRIYSVSQNGNFKIINSSNPSSLSLIANLSSYDFNYASNIKVMGDYVYMSETGGGDHLHIINVSNDNIVITGSYKDYPTTGNTLAIEIFEENGQKYLLSCTNQYDTLTLWNVTNNENISSIVSTGQISSNPYSLDACKYLYFDSSKYLVGVTSGTDDTFSLFNISGLNQLTGVYYYNKATSPYSSDFDSSYINKNSDTLYYNDYIVFGSPVNDEITVLKIQTLPTYEIDISLDYINESNYYQNENIQINGSVNFSETTTRTLTINNTDFTNFGNVTNFNFKNNTPLSIGDYYLKITAEDLNTNSSEIIKVSVVDYPELEIQTSFTNNSLVFAHGNVNIDGNVSHYFDVTTSINDSRFTNFNTDDDFAFINNTPLYNGHYAVTITTSDGVDTLYLNLEFDVNINNNGVGDIYLNHNNDTYLQNESIYIDGYSNSDIIDYFFVNDFTNIGTGKNFSFKNLSSYNIGNYNKSVYVNTLDGNVNSTIYYFSISDYLPMDFNMSYVNETTITNHSNISISGNVTNYIPLSTTINSTKFTNTGSNKFFNFVNNTRLFNGNYYLKIYSTEINVNHEEVYLLSVNIDNNDEPVVGCMNATAYNYNPLANIPATCNFIEPIALGSCPQTEQGQKILWGTIILLIAISLIGILIKIPMLAFVTEGILFLMILIVGQCSAFLGMMLGVFTIFLMIITNYIKS